MTTRLGHSQPVTTTTDRPPPDLRGTWTIDPTTSVVSFAWRALRLWTITGRWHCSGVIHLDGLPPVGVIRFQQPSGLPFLTMELDPVSPQTGTADRRQRRCTLHSHSLETLPGGAWRVMATLTTHRALELIELRIEVDPKHSRRDWLALRGRAVLARRALATGRRASSLDPTIWLELAVHARRVAIHLSKERHEGDIDRRPSMTQRSKPTTANGQVDGYRPSVPSLACQGPTRVADRMPSGQHHRRTNRARGGPAARITRSAE
jgi:hypothetical protein